MKITHGDLDKFMSQFQDRSKAVLERMLKGEDPRDEQVQALLDRVETHQTMVRYIGVSAAFLLNSPTPGSSLALIISTTLQIAYDLGVEAGEQKAMRSMIGGLD